MKQSQKKFSKKHMSGHPLQLSHSPDQFISNLQNSFQFVFITQAGCSVNYFKFSIMFFLLLISAVSVRAAGEQQLELISPEPSDINPLMDFCENDNDGIESLVKSRIVYDPDVKPEELGCDEIVSSILKTTQQLPGSLEHISRVLSNNQFTLFCTTPERINNIVSDHVQPSAIFDSENKRIYATSTELTPGLIIHEFLHADTFFRHTNERCYTSDKEAALFPLYPASRQNIQFFQQALDIGDKRVVDYKKLWDRTKQGYELTQQERERLAAYDAAVKDCLAPLIEDVNSKETYDSLLKMGYQPGMKGFKLTRGNDTREIISIKRTQTKTIIYMRQLDQALAFFENIKTVHDKLQGGYKHKSLLIKLIERDAYTFQNLSEEASKTFYLEAYKLRQLDIEKCDSTPKCNLNFP